MNQNNSNTLLLDYLFNNPNVSNPDRTFPIQFSEDVTVVQEKIDSKLGLLLGGRSLGIKGKGIVNLEGLQPDFSRFCIRVVFCATTNVASRQNLVASNRLPFSLYLDKGNQEGEFIAQTTIALIAHGWQSASTLFSQSLKAGVWYTLDLVYDTDTIAIFVDGSIAALQAFPNGQIVAQPGDELYVGTWVDGLRDHFQGKIAALQVWSGIPPELEKHLDESRSHPEWFISYKRINIKGTFDLGLPKAAISFNPVLGAYIQHHQHGVIMYHDSLGAAFEMHGAIYQFYLRYSQIAQLEYLISDEKDASRTSRGRKNTFSKGAVYWSPATGAIPVTDRIFLNYESMHGIDIIGFPTKLAHPVPGGVEQEFQKGRIYYRTGSHTAHEVHGAILAKYLAIGGVKTWGFPTTNEVDVKKNGMVIGKMSVFENCTIYWSNHTGAFEVHGDIRKHYMDLNGPANNLGFPISDEMNIPGVSGKGRANTFENGSLLWYGSKDSIVYAGPFTIFLERIDSREDEGFAQGQNDIYFRLTVKEKDQIIYNERHPRSGQFDGHNIIDPKINIPNVIIPNDLNKKVTFTADIWDFDNGGGGSDDHLGIYTKVLDPANGWGFRENQGILNSGSFSKINSIQWSVKPKVDPSTLTETQKFWGVRNRSTPRISFEKYAAAFADVDSDPEVDLTDYMEGAFYDLIVDELASRGNCYGMVLEAIYALKNLSRFSLPLDRFINWNILETEFNIKHCYQVGMQAIWWFVDQFLKGKTHDPKYVFQKTRDAFHNGQHPILCLSQNYDFSGAPHGVLPVKWNDQSIPWIIDIHDPNFPKEIKHLRVDPNKNTFRYEGAAIYKGGAWSGGRMHFMPFNILGVRPNTPIWDSIMLILKATVVIIGSDAQTESIRDLNGSDLNANGQRAKTMMQQGKSIEDFFVSFKGIGGDKGIIAGEFLMTTNPNEYPVLTPLTRFFNSSSPSRLLTPLQFGLVNQPNETRLLANHSLAHFLADPKKLAEVNDDTINRMKQIRFASRRGDFHHRIKGVRDGGYLSYILKQGMKEIQMSGEMKASDSHDIRIRDLATNQATIKFKTNRDKQVNFIIKNKLGTSGDHIKLSIGDLPVSKMNGLEMNIRSGLGGMDIMTGGARVKIPINIEAQINGRQIKRNYVLPSEGGIRVQISDALSQSGTVQVGVIEKIFAPISKIKKIPQVQ